MLMQCVSFAEMDRSYGVWHQPYVRMPYWKWPCATVVCLAYGDPVFGTPGCVVTSYRLNEFGLERYARFYRKVTRASEIRLQRLAHAGKIELNAH